ncbi:hypothetical protein D3C81_1794840 [compost metagenome]
MRPALKIGIATDAPYDHVCAAPTQSPESAVLAAPNSPVSVMVGKYSARAAPISALAATSCCSACNRSGRCSSRSDGRPDGIVGGRNSPIGRPRGMARGFSPISTDSRFSCCDTSWS